MRKWLSLACVLALTVWPSPLLAQAAEEKPSISARFEAPREFDASKGKALYHQYCATCHGASGRGDGPAAAGMPVKPRNHTDGAYMNSLSDSHLKKVITQGGASVGKSGMMPAWGTILDDTEVQDVITHLRALTVPPYKGG